MAMRGTGYAKRSAGTAATQAGGSAYALSDAETATRAIPLDLSALISPYRGHGRISLRVERLPHRTRLSRGQNNGDRSWSLSLDDLDGLNFLTPKDLRGAHILSIRVVSLDGGDGATVAVLEHSISPSDGPTAVLKGASAAKAAVLADHAAADRLREELEKLKASHAAQETALAEMRQSLDQEWEVRARQLADSELKAARTDWEGEVKKKLAEAAKRTTAEVEQVRRALQTEQDARLAKAESLAATRLEQERQRWQKESDAVLAAAEKAWKKAEAARVAAAEEKWRELSSQLEAQGRSHKNFDALLAKAEKSWKEGEAARLAAAQAQWQVHTKNAVEDALESSEKVAHALRSRLESDWKAQEATRFAEANAEWQQQLDKVRAETLAHSQKEASAALQAAQKLWQTEEAARTAAAETKWQEHAERLVAKARAQGSTAGKADEAGQLNRLRNEIAAANKTLQDRETELESARRAAEEAQRLLRQERADKANHLERLRDELVIANKTLEDRDAELSSVRRAAEDLQRHMRQEAATAFSEAQKEWDKEVASRLAAAETEWHERTTSLVAEARAQALALSKTDEGSQIGLLRDELAVVGKTLANRDAELAQTRRAITEANERLPQQIAIALSDAQQIWSTEEAARLADAKARWGQQFAKALAEARTSAASATDDSVELGRLRSELSAAQTALAQKTQELTLAQQTPEAGGDRSQQQIVAAVAEARANWAAAEAARLASAEEKWREDFQAKMSEATARYQKAEAELAETLARAGESGSTREKVEILRLREEVESLKSTIAIRDVELAQAHATAEQMRKRLSAEPSEILPALDGRRSLPSDGERPEHRDETVKRPMWRDIALVAAVAAFGILLYPHVMALVPYDWWPESSYSDDAAPAPAPRHPAPPAADQPTDVVIRAANVHSGPSKTASVVATLDPNVGVKTIERHGNWVHIAFSAGDAKTHDGWVFNTFLKPAPAASSKPVPSGAH